MNIKALKDFLDSMNYPVLISVSDCVNWAFEHDDTILWVSKSNRDGVDLDGYSCHLPEGYSKQDDYLIANLDTQTGCWQTEVFPLDKEMSCDEFYDKYGEFM